MTYSPSSSLNRLARAGVLAVAVVMVVAGAASPAAAVDDPAAPPSLVRRALPVGPPRGGGELRFRGLRIYGARLWVGPQFKAADFGDHPLALELKYHRAFKGTAIAQRSIDEIRRQGELAPALAQHWQKALTALLPDVQPGDRLTGLYQPGQGMRFWRGEQPLGATDDAELARRFFAIWLSPTTSEPGLRSALLARRLEGGP